MIALGAIGGKLLMRLFRPMGLPRSYGAAIDGTGSHAIGMRIALGRHRQAILSSVHAATAPSCPPVAVSRIAIVAAVVLAELVVIGGMLWATRLDCGPIGQTGTCDAISWVVTRGAGTVGLGALYLAVRLRPRAGSDPGPDSREAPARFWPAVQVAGFALLILPLVLAGEDVERLFAIGGWIWVPGTAMATVGALFWLMPWRAWASLLRADPLTPIGLVALGLAAPALASRADLAWSWAPLSRVTFEGVAALARLFGDARAVPEKYTIYFDYFAVEIADACSGIQGFALITGSATPDG